MNSGVYDDLSDEQKACVDGTSGVEMARQIGKFWDEADSFGETESAKTGSQVVMASDEERAYFKEKTADIEAAVLKEIESRGVDAAAAFEFMKSQLQ